MKTIAKKAITFGLAALMLVSCGKDKKKVDPNAGVGISPFGVGANPNSGTFFNQVLAQYSCNRLTRHLSYSNGTLSAIGGPSAGSFMEYTGVDTATGDVLVLREYGQNNYQLSLSICSTGDQFVDNMLINGQPQIDQQFLWDANVPNRSACPTGRINMGGLFFGYAPNGYPIIMRFQPPQQCM